jgi:hypothetical protein
LELRPYVKAASSWLVVHRASVDVGVALQELNWVLAFAGRVDPAMNLRGQSAAYRAKVAFARLREAGIEPHRLLAIYLGVSALMEDDLGSHRVKEFRIVQVAKAVHRLASGTHRRWENHYAGSGQIELHAYPRSSGLVLRRIGDAIEKACGPVAKLALRDIIDLKTAKDGVHRSHLPGWRPIWMEKASSGHSAV